MKRSLSYSALVSVALAAVALSGCSKTFWSEAVELDGNTPHIIEPQTLYVTDGCFSSVMGGGSYTYDVTFEQAGTYGIDFIAWSSCYMSVYKADGTTSWPTTYGGSVERENAEGDNYDIATTYFDVAANDTLKIKVKQGNQWSTGTSYTLYIYEKSFKDSSTLEKSLAF